MASFDPLQGMADISWPTSSLWQQLEKKARDIFSLYGFREVRTPLLEKQEVFLRSLGDSTDIVQKEMYAFEDRGGRPVALRPEGTASVMRYVASRGQEMQNARLYYIGPMFRCERPQKGRYRQFHQTGVEAIGAPNPLADAEVIALQYQLLAAWEIPDIVIQLNTRGTAEDQAVLGERMRDILRPNLESLCEDCKRRFETNVMRVLDCKNDQCRSFVRTLPSPVDLMSDDSRSYLDTVESTLNNLGIKTVRNPHMVRGLDYYCHTIWEIVSEELGAQNALTGGGRYSMQLGNQNLEGVGFAVGMERILLALNLSEDEVLRRASQPMLWLVNQNDEAFQRNFDLMQQLRSRGIPCGMDLKNRKMKQQFRMADREAASWVLVRGEQELTENKVTLKDMVSGEQSECAEADLFDRLDALFR